MRDVKELLEVLLIQYQKHKDDTVRDEGLCYAIKRLHAPHGIFTKAEKDILMSFIYEYRPDSNIEADDWWWDRGIIYPRVRFLKQLINRL